MSVLTNKKRPVLSERLTFLASPEDFPLRFNHTAPRPGPPSAAQKPPLPRHGTARPRPWTGPTSGEAPPTGPRGGSRRALVPNSLASGPAPCAQREEAGRGGSARAFWACFAAPPRRWRRAGGGGRPEEVVARGAEQSAALAGRGAPRRGRAAEHSRSVGGEPSSRAAGDKAEGGAELAPPHPGADRGGCAVGRRWRGLGPVKMDLARTIILLCSCVAGAGGEERPGPPGSAGPWPAALPRGCRSPSLPPSLSSLRRGAGLGAAGPAPRCAAPQRPGGRPRLGRRLGLPFRRPLPGHGPHRPARALSPRRLGLARRPRLFPGTFPRRGPSQPFFSPSFPMVLGCAVPCPAPLRSLGTFLTAVPVAASRLPSSPGAKRRPREAEAAAVPRTSPSPRPLPGTRKHGQAESSASGNRRRARDFPEA